MTPSEGVAEPRRLHPASLLFTFLTMARHIVVPALIGLVFSPVGGAQFWVLIALVPTSLAAVARYVSYRYALTDDELVIRQGIVIRNERHVPYARIQNINRVQNPLHRMFGVAEVHIETASGTKPEAIIRVVSIAEIDAIREHVFAQRAVPGAVASSDAAPALDPADGPRELVHMDTRDLVLFGLISNRGMVIVAAAVGVLSQLDVSRHLPDWTTRAIEQVRGWSMPGPVVSAVAAVAAVILALVAMRLLSIVWAYLKFHGFRLIRTGDNLRADYGLLTRISANVPRHRIQLLSSARGWLHRRTGRAMVRVETAGGGSGGKDEGSGIQNVWLAPLIEDGRVPHLIREALPGVETHGIEWQSLASRARGRVFRRSLRVWIVIAALAAVATRGWGLLVLLPAIPVAAVHASLYVRYTKWALTDAAILFKSGWWTRRLSVVRFEKVQSVRRRHNPFDRRAGMATVTVDTAGAGKVGHRVAIRYLPEAVAADLANRLAREAGTRSFRW